MDSLKDLLKGIDELENESPEGWWETSKGADFGALILSGAIKIEQQLQQENAALKAELEAAKLEADTLAMSLWRNDWQAESPEFELCDTPSGVISQIDNMVSGLVKKSDLNKIKADAIREAIKVCDKYEQVVACSISTSIEVKDLEEHANRIEAGE
jgi:hypothetical protein